MSKPEGKKQFPEPVPSAIARAENALPPKRTWTAADGIAMLIIALLSGGIYVRTLAPTVVGGNSAEYQYVPYILGVVHSTGYPLYTLLAKLFTFLPMGTLAYRVNLLSAVAAAGAAAAVYALLHQLTGRRIVSVALSLGFAFAASFWSAALVAEVHTLNVFLVTLSLFLLLRWAERQQLSTRAGRVSWANLRVWALTYGLSLAHHRTTLLLAPAFLVFIFWVLRQARARPFVDGLRPVSITLALLLAPLLLYAYIPLAGGRWLSSNDPSVTAIYNHRVPEAILRGTVTSHYRPSLAGFVNLVTGQDYAADLGLTSWDQLVERLVLWLRRLAEQFTPVGYILTIVGMVALMRRDRQTGLLFLLGYFSLVAFAIFYVGHGQIWYYFMPSYVFTIGLFAVASDEIWRLLERRRPHPAAESDQPPLFDIYLVYAALWFILPVALIANNFAHLDMSEYRLDEARARETLTQPLEPKAVVMGPWDLVTSLRYMQYAEGIRPDLIVIHGDPAYSSGEKIMKQCVRLKRPLYLLTPTTLEATLAARYNHYVDLTPIPYYGPVEFGNAPINFGGRIALLGAQFTPNPVRLDPFVGGAVAMQFFWRSESASKINYKLLGDLIGPEGLTRARIDESPVSVYYPTSQWPLGQTLRGEIWLTLQPGLPPGDYYLHVGLYDPDTGQRLHPSIEPASLDTVKVGPLHVHVEGK